MKNVKFRGKKTNSAVQILGKPKFRSSARNSAGRGKLGPTDKHQAQHSKPSIGEPLPFYLTSHGITQTEATNTARVKHQQHIALTVNGSVKHLRSRLLMLLTMLCKFSYLHYITSEIEQSVNIYAELNEVHLASI